MTTTVLGTLEEVSARMVRALEQQGFGATAIRGGSLVSRTRVVPFERYAEIEVHDEEPRRRGRRLRGGRRGRDAGAESGGRFCHVLLGETRGRVNVTIELPEARFDIVEAAPPAKLAGVPLGVRNRLRAALASLEGQP
jgi:hypothetical protein